MIPSLLVPYRHARGNPIFHLHFVPSPLAIPSTPPLLHSSPPLLPENRRVYRKLVFSHKIEKSCLKAFMGKSVCKNILITGIYTYHFRLCFTHPARPRFASEFDETNGWGLDTFFRIKSFDFAHLQMSFYFQLPPLKKIITHYIVGIIGLCLKPQ